MMEERICPLCGAKYRAVPAISRTNNKTQICPDCGTREALDSLGIDIDERERIVGIIHAHTKEAKNEKD